MPTEEIWKDEQPSMDHRRERIRIETERQRIEGYLTLARDGYRSRVSDVLNASERDFITLTEATVEAARGRRARAAPVPHAGAPSHRLRGGRLGDAGITAPGAELDFAD